MPYPDFLCIGARKAGTTWLHDNLAQQPGVYLPPVKEVHYFDHGRPWLPQRLFGRASHLANARAYLAQTLRDLRRGGSWDDVRWAAGYCLRRRGDGWYRSLFPDDEGLVRGEVCPGYARLDAARVAAVAARMPDAKIIYFMRDPLECAWSSAGAHFGKKKGARGVMYADPADVKRYLARPNSVSHLSFARNLAAWSERFPESRMLLSYYDDLKADPERVYRRVLSFLGFDGAQAAIPDGVARKRGTVEGRRSQEIPAMYRRFLGELYLESLVELDRRVGNAHTHRWLEAARAAAG